MVFPFVILIGCNSGTIEYTEEQRVINKKIISLANKFHERGGILDSGFYSFDEIEKLDYLIKEIESCMFLTDQMTKSSHKLDTVKLDSNYYGRMFLCGYNRYMANKLVVKYNNSILEVPIDDKSMEYKYKLKPLKLGQNIYNGFIVQGKDTYNFGYNFYVIK